MSPLRNHGGTGLTPEHWEFLDSLGISYRQWTYWQEMGWVGVHRLKDLDEVSLHKLKLLARAAQIKDTPINELADLLATEELERL